MFFVNLLNCGLLTAFTCSLLASTSIQATSLALSPCPPVFVVVYLTLVGFMKSEQSLLDSLKWNNWFWHALLVREGATEPRVNHCRMRPVP